MRVLLTAQFPLDSSPSERHCRALAEVLQQRGHDVHLLVASDDSQPAGPFPLRVIRCRKDDPSADLGFSLPVLAPGPHHGTTFAALSSQQLAEYREQFRQQLDREVAEFDPHIIHCQHVWLEGQLALETGVPYVLTGWEAELTWWHDPRFHALVEQAAENASRVVVATQALADEFASRAEAVRDRLIVVEELESPGASGAGLRMEEVYRAAFQQRFDRDPE